MKKYLLIIFFLGIYLFPTSVLADTVVPKPSTSSWQDTLAGIASDVITLHNPVQLKNPKNNFSASEKPTFTLSIPTHTPDALGKFNSNIWKTKQENIKAAIVYQNGTEYPATNQKNAEGQFSLSLDTKELNRGDYKLYVSSTETAIYTRNLTQDFSWGVLAVNTDKSVYVPNETAHLSFGIVDNLGHTLCHADIQATITDTSGKVTTFSTDNNTIKRSSECAGDSYTPTPDYTANYQVNNPGVYKMH